MDKMMIEKVARAICVADGGTPDACPSRQPNWKLYAIQARAAIRAYNPDDRLSTLARTLLAAWDDFLASDANQQEAYYRLAKAPWGTWEELRSALSPLPQGDGDELGRAMIEGVHE